MKNPLKQVAKTLKKARQQRGWSLDKTAQETGVSKAMLGQIEREESSPTIAILWKIATGLQVAFSEFIESTDSKTVEHHVMAEHSFDPVNDKIHIKSIFPFDPKLRCEMFILELLPGCEHLSLPHQTDVVEHVIVIEGQLEVLVKRRWRKIRAQEGLKFSADQAHGYRNTSKYKAIFHNIIHYP